jgi:hypothetical protein
VKRKVTAFVLLIAFASFIACKGASPFQKSPGEVVKAFLTAANDGKYSDAKALLSDDATKAIDGELGQLAGGFKKICDSDTKDGTITQVDIVKEEIRGEGATVIATIHYKDGSKKSEDKNQLILEKGSWKLTIGD